MCQGVIVYILIGIPLLLVRENYLAYVELSCDCIHSRLIYLIHGIPKCSNPMIEVTT